MGYWSEVDLALSQGYMSEDLKYKHVCLEHLEDIFLKAWMNEHSSKGTCSYCQKENIEVVNMYDFMTCVKEKLSSRFNTIDGACLPLANGFLEEGDEEELGFTRYGSVFAPSGAEQYESTEDMLYYYSLFTDNETLNEDILSCFPDNAWIKEDYLEADLNEELSRAWNFFVNLIKERRFTYFASPIFKPEELWNEDILTEVKSLCLRLLLTSIPKNSTIYRGRPNDDVIDSFTQFSDLTSPPSQYAKSNRMSAEGVSMFYGAFDKATVRQEICSYCSPHSIDIGEFRVKKELHVVDLFKIPRTLSFWMPEGCEEYKFLSRFHDEITKPLAKGDTSDYVPTQAFTEYLRFMTDRKIDGLIYRSAQSGKKNIVLFYDAPSSSDILNLVSVEKIQ